VFSSDRLKHWLSVAELRAVPDVIPRSGPAGAAVRGVSVMLVLDGEQLQFRRIEGESVFCLGLDDDEHFSVECCISVYDAWRAEPIITEYWGLVSFTFDNWPSYEREQLFRWERVKFVARRIRRSVRNRVAAFRKQVAVERYAVLNTVKSLKTDVRVPHSLDVAGSLLGNDWTDKLDAFDRLDQIEVMLDALVDLGELRKNGIGYEVTGKGIAALSQYEEEERKHRESMSLQKGIRWLTVVMAVAALLQARVVKFPELWTINAWPWN